MALGENQLKNVNALIEPLRSKVNSSYIALSGGASFIGQWEPVAAYALSVIIVGSDVDSATDGLHFQWSGDGATLHFEEVTSVRAGVPRSFAFTRRGDYFRVKYDNGASAQTIFHVCVSHSVSGTGIITRALDKELTEENFAQTVRSVVTRLETSGQFSNVGINAPMPIEIHSGRSLMEYIAGKLVYTGTNIQTASVDATSWIIKKLFYTGNDVIDVQVLTGAWSNRAGLSWKSAGGD